MHFPSLPNSFSFHILYSVIVLALVHRFCILKTCPAMATTYTQHHLTLPSLGRGSHLVTDHITSSLPQISGIKCGLLHLFLQHTSCALSMNENWDDDVRADMSDALDGIVKEDKGVLGSGMTRREDRLRLWVLADGLYEQLEKESTGTMQRGATICRYVSPQFTT